MSDYLWDKSGAPDPEVARLEELLGRYRHQGAPPVPPAKRWRAWPIAASVVLAASASWMATRGGPRVAWEVARVEGAPAIASRPIGDAGELGIGEWLETDQSSRARLAVGSIGQVDVGPGSRLRLERARAAEHRLALERGEIRAMIWAPPGTFYVDTPSAVAVDLGCLYDLTVDERGAGLLRVILGWVGFERNGQESFIPAGALCRTRRDLGLGTPYYEDASGALRDALTRLDFEGGGIAAVEVVLAEARQRDAITLWHLLAKGGGIERGMVYDRMATLIPPPAGVTREGILSGDRRMRDLWWDALGLENTAWWRRWERKWEAK